MSENEGSMLSGGYPESSPLPVHISWEGEGVGACPLPHFLSSFHLCRSRQMDRGDVLDVRRIFLFGFLLLSLVYRKDK